MTRAFVLGFGIWALGFGISAPALAQSPYVAGAIGADVSRVSHADSSLYSSSSNGGEVLSGALRVGTSVGSNWGVELEFARSGRSNDQGPIINPLVQAGISTAIAQLVPPGVVPGYTVSTIPFTFRSDVTRRHTSVDAVAWARQSVSGSIDLVYLGGIAFSRDRSDITQSINLPRSIAPQAIIAFVPQTEFHSIFISYATRPLVGMEARIGFTTRLRLIPGFRVQGLGDGWLLRPYVGLGWFF
jgi:hypothetical protein